MRIPRSFPLFICVALTLTAGIRIDECYSTVSRAHLADDSVFPDPGLSNPRLRFHLGKAGPQGPIISPSLPEMPGPPSAWFVTQWSQGEQLMHPDAMTKADPATRDPSLGVASYAFSAPDGHSHFWIYDDKPRKRYVYDLYERGGTVGANGGSNIFISAHASDPDATLDRPITYSVSLRLPRANVSFATPAAHINGAVLAQVFSGFIFRVQPRESRKVVTVFLQILHASSRNRPSGYYSCSYNDNGAVILDGRNLPEDLQLPFAPSRGPLQRLHYLLNTRICALLRGPLPCTDQKGRQSAFDLRGWKLSNLASWRLTSMYVGTRNSRSRHASGRNRP